MHGCTRDTLFQDRKPASLNPRPFRCGDCCDPLSLSVLRFQDAGDVRHTVNGALSLSEGRLYYARCGASHPRFLPYVRKAKDSEQ